MIGFNARQWTHYAPVINFIASIHRIRDRSKFHSENSDARVAEHYHSETICLSNDHRGRRNARVIPREGSTRIPTAFYLRFCFGAASRAFIPLMLVHQRAPAIAIIVLERCEKFVSSFRVRRKKDGWPSVPR